MLLRVERINIVRYIVVTAGTGGKSLGIRQKEARVLACRYIIQYYFHCYMSVFFFCRFHNFSRLICISGDVILVEIPLLKFGGILVLCDLPTYGYVVKTTVDETR